MAVCVDWRDGNPISRMGYSVFVDIFIMFIIFPIGSMYGIYANIGGILMVNVTIYSIHGSYGFIRILYTNYRLQICYVSIKIPRSSIHFL